MGLDVVTVDDVLTQTDIFVTATGNKGIISSDMMSKMKTTLSFVTLVTSTMKSIWQVCTK